eukprot:12365372-Alexandrium_andersonii.AAC.1
MHQRGVLPLVYRAGSAPAAVPPREREALIHAAMPPEVAAAWRVAAQGHFRAANEADALPALEWLRGSGPASGV